MIKQKHISKIISAITVIMLVITMVSTVFAETVYDTENATSFVFSDEGITAIDGAYTSYTVDGTSLTIKGSGTYILSGSCQDGSITVKKGTTGVVLILNGLVLTSSTTAPITCNKSTEVVIVAADGTVNTLTDSEYNNDETHTENTEAENAVIKGKDGSKITLTGTGTLNIVSNGKNGIKGGATTETEGDAYITIENITLNITANVNDALKTDQELNILSGNITIIAQDDAIKSDLVLNIGQTGTDGPTITITNSIEGIEAATLNIYSGNINVTATDDGINAANSDLTNYSFACNIYGGNLYVNAINGDGIDSNGTLSVYGGNIEVYSSASNDNAPLDSEGTFTLSGGTVLAVGSSSMAQSPNTVSQNYITFGTNTFGMMGQNNQQSASVSIKANDAITIIDATGNTLYSATALRNASYVLFSSASLNKSSNYQLAINGTVKATALASTVSAAVGNLPGQPGAFPGTNPGQQNGQGEFMQPGNFQPQNGNLQPQNGNLQPQNANFQPQNGNLQPQNGNFQPQQGTFPEAPNGQNNQANNNYGGFPGQAPNENNTNNTDNTQNNFAELPDISNGSNNNNTNELPTIGAAQTNTPTADNTVTLVLAIGLVAVAFVALAEAAFIIIKKFKA